VAFLEFGGGKKNLHEELQARHLLAISGTKVKKILGSEMDCHAIYGKNVGTTNQQK